MKRTTIDELNQIHAENSNYHRADDEHGVVALHKTYGATIGEVAFYAITDRDEFEKYIRSIHWDNVSKTLNMDLYEIAKIESIRTAREEAGLTLTKMSKLTGIPLRTIQSWESGERSCPEWTQKLVIRDLKGWKESRSIFTDKTIERLTLDAKNYKSDEEQKFIEEVGWEDWMEEYIKDEYDESGVKEVDTILKGIFREAHQDF